MTMYYKEKHTLAERKKESEKIKKKHADVVPVILELAEDVDVGEDVKRKYLAPKALKTHQFEHLLRKRFSALTRVHFTVAGRRFGDKQAEMGEVYDAHHDEDGFLYLTMCKKPAFSFEDLYSPEAEKLRQISVKTRQEAGEFPEEPLVTESTQNNGDDEDLAENFETLDVGMISKAIDVTAWLMVNTVGLLIPRFGSAAEENEIRAEREVHTVDVEAIRTNWYGRHQKRLYRFTPDSFMRLDPSTKDVRCVFHYDNIKEIKVQDNRYIVIKFHDKSKYGNESIETLSANVVKELITKRIHPTKEFKHTFMNDHNYETINASSCQDLGAHYKLFLELGLVEGRDGEVIEKSEEDVAKEEEERLEAEKGDVSN